MESYRLHSTMILYCLWPIHRFSTVCRLQKVNCLRGTRWFYKISNVKPSFRVEMTADCRINRIDEIPSGQLPKTYKYRRGTLTIQSYPIRLLAAAEICYMLLLWWHSIKLQYKKQTGLQFMSLVPTSLRICWTIPLNMRKSVPYPKKKFLNYSILSRCTVDIVL
jgi:hypothetical protein